MMAASKTEDYQLLGEVLDQGLKELSYSRKELSVELFASDKQHVLDLYCSKGKNCSYKFYWPSFGMAYGNPSSQQFSPVQRCVCKQSKTKAIAQHKSEMLCQNLAVNSRKCPDRSALQLSSTNKAEQQY